MYYDISRALEIMPYVSLGLIVTVLIILEVISFREAHADSLFYEGDEGDNFKFPPGDHGYEYYPRRGIKVYIVKKASNRFRVYLVQGEANGVKLKHDRYGHYVTLRCENTGTAEKISDRLFGG